MAKNTIDFSPTNPENAEAGAQEAVEKEPLQVDVGPVEETKPPVVTMTPEEFAELKAQGDSARAVKEGLEGLSEKLGQQRAPQAMPVNAPTQTPEEFYAEHSDDMFDKEKGGALMAKYTKMVSEREYGPLLRGMSSALSNTRKELLEAKDPHFKKYKLEVDALVAQQPSNVQMQPDIYELAWQTVRAKHQPEIEAQSVKEQVDAAVEAKLKELGIDPAKPVNPRPAAHVNSEGRSTPNVTTESRPRIRLPDAATKAKLDKEALKRGLDPEDLYRTRGF